MPFKILRIVPYTTRPRREGETDGRDYVFTDETHVQATQNAGKVIEVGHIARSMGSETFTVDDGRIDLSAHSYLYIVTLEGYCENTKILWKLTVVPLV